MEIGEIEECFESEIIDSHMRYKNHDWNVLKVRYEKMQSQTILCIIGQSIQFGCPCKIEIPFGAISYYYRNGDSIILNVMTENAETEESSEDKVIFFLPSSFGQLN